ncbi:ent-kaur-16-ene synthase, chloroplastic-like [Dioscorea cayenensis subsp. rotundata]|uniref:Ent-kaur-16-ene synthase, chloroplastic-like n=1 Tax=Dioscorea cayennensis subsp. rotundata TaxID=55577 RepID=A0AB40AFU0_DIOCR|nr:ent-kaur-16-ene synthase, chloroplastic-like [Dioscorea cayenensis subsp. rotundata]
MDPLTWINYLNIYILFKMFVLISTEIWQFRNEIKSILDQTYRGWVQKDEDFMSNVSTCALACRLLRMDGYDVTSEYLAQYEERNSVDNSMEGYKIDVNAVLELFKASHVKIFPPEEVLDKLNSWTSHFLREELSTFMTNDLQNVFKEVDYALKFPLYANLDRLEHKRNIEQSRIEDFQILKTACISHGVDKKDILELALDEFKMCQSIYQKELTDLERWTKENKLDQLKFARQKVAYCYLAASGVMQINIIFSEKMQKFDIDLHGFWQWLSLLKSMMEEAEWLRNKSVPTLDEYMENGYVSFALGPIIIPALYFIVPDLPEDIVDDPEYQNLYRLVSTGGRLLNDIHSLERGKEGKLNSVALRILHGNSSVSEEEAKRDTMNLINSTRCELLRMVLQNKASVVPRACKEFFWNMSRTMHLIYLRTDGFSSPKEMVSAVNAVIYEPLDVSHLF